MIYVGIFMWSKIMMIVGGCTAALILFLMVFLQRSIINFITFRILRAKKPPK
jgi:hypothetical protein